MRRFPCPVCGQQLFFGNDQCGSCETEVAYRPLGDRFVAVATAEQDAEPCASRGGPGACNWVAGSSGLCANCVLDFAPDQSSLVVPFQDARRRTLRELFALGLDPAKMHPPLRFDLEESSPDDPVTTGHADGVITLDIAEGDPVRLAEIRTRLGEQYRTPVGHVRHELGHWYWTAMVDADNSLLGSEGLDDFRSVFGDERLDYADALERYYSATDDGSWRSSYISHYASAHPWEDFAETFAHYLHLIDTLETAQAFPLVARQRANGGGLLNLDFDVMYTQWMQLTVGLNELNRSMGGPDAYPFSPPKPAVAKLRWLHHRLIDPKGSRTDLNPPPAGSTES